MSWFSRFCFAIFLLCAIQIGITIWMEISMASREFVYVYESHGWMRECTKWDNVSRRFIVSLGEGGLGEIVVPDNHSPASVLSERVVFRDFDFQGNNSIGITLDYPRNRMLMAVGDAFGWRYGGLAAYDMTTWNRLFFTHLTSPGESNTYAEDVAVDAEGNAYVTDIKGARIWKVGINGELITTITSPLFRRKGWFRNIFTLNGIVYHPNGYLLVIHTMNGDLFKIEINNGNKITLVKVKGGPLIYGDGMNLLSATKLAIASYPSTRLVESTDDWETANVVGKYRGPLYRLPTAVTVKDDKVIVNYFLGNHKHVLAEARFTSSDSIVFRLLDLVASLNFHLAP